MEVINQISEVATHQSAVASVTTSLRPVAEFHPNVWGTRFLSYKPDVNQLLLLRSVASFHPSVWGTRFLSPNSELNHLARRKESSLKAQELIHELKCELNEAAKSPKKQLQLIDSIQKLSIEHHFEKEIDQVLQNIFQTFHDFCEANNDLHSIALSFRLLRQQGHMISCEIFDKFKDDKGDFMAYIFDDVAGLLEFYEATYLSIQGEYILDHGRAFSRARLQSVLPGLSNPLAEQVFHALNRYSKRRGLPRLEARHYLSMYEQHEDTRHNQTLIKLAKLDFNLLQSIHKAELSEICSWWKGLDFATNLPYVRDRMVECYFWLLGVFFEPQHALARSISSRVMALVSAIDDTYDAYATFEELEIFTEAIERWDIKCLDSLPEYMKVLYTALLKLFEEIDEELTKLGKSYRLIYGKEVVKEVARAYFDESKWLKKKYTPNMEEYLSVASISSGYKTMIIVSFLGIGDIVTKEAFDWVLGSPNTVKAALTICRVQHDVSAHEFERERNHIPSSVECYMNEYRVTKQEAAEQLNERIESAWKDINEAFRRPTEIPTPLLNIILNFTRIMEVIYKKGDWYTHVGLEMQNYIKQLLVDPIPE